MKYAISFMVAVLTVVLILGFIALMIVVPAQAAAGMFLVAAFVLLWMLAHAIIYN